MKKMLLSIIPVVALLSIAFTGCKKDGDSAGIVLAGITDSAGATVLDVTYNNEGKPSRIVTADARYEFFYEGGKLIKRLFIQGDALTSTDSFFYDGNNRYARIDKYDADNDKLSTTVFAYNADNTLNTITVTSNGFGTTDHMFEFTYSGSNLSVVKEYEKVFSTFNLRRQFELLAFDGRQNPVQTIIKNYVPDQVNLLTVLFWSANNFTSAKQTDYNVNNGEVTGSFPATASYTYNSSGLPLEVTGTFNGNTNRSTFRYTSL